MADTYYLPDGRMHTIHSGETPRDLIPLVEEYMGRDFAEYFESLCDELERLDRALEDEREFWAEWTDEEGEYL